MENDDLYTAPAFQFYGADFVSDTLDLTTEQKGAYLLLLIHQWQRGFVPQSPEARAQIAGVPAARMGAIWAALGDRFRASENGFQNRRLERVREDARLYHEGRSTSARVAAETRWAQKSDASRNANALRTHQRGNADASVRQCHKPTDAMPQNAPPVSSLQLDLLRKSFPEKMRPDLDGYLAAAATENKTGKIALSRQCSLLRALAAEREKLEDDEAFAAGLRVANAAGAANPIYVRKAARSAQRRGDAPAVVCALGNDPCPLSPSECKRLHDDPTLKRFPSALEVPETDD